MWKLKEIEDHRIDGGFHGLHFLMEQRSLSVERKMNIGKKFNGIIRRENDCHKNPGKSRTVLKSGEAVRKIE
jgi:hypothetical protein